MAAILDDQIFDHIGSRSGVNAYSAHVYTACLARAQFVKLENIAALDQDYAADRTMHRARHFRMQLQLPVLAVNRNEILRLYQINDELEFFLASVSTHMDWRR